MKILIFSDTHLDSKFEPKKLDYLNDIVSMADKVIINGDLWEGYDYSFDQFLRSPWKSLLKKLKHKNSIYLHGNHDPAIWVDAQKASVFSDELHDSYKLEIGDKKFHIEHGHRRVASLENLFPFFKKRALFLASKPFERQAFFHNKGCLRRIYEYQNNKIKKWIQHTMDDSNFFVTGHTHYQEFSDNFINLGAIRYGVAQHMWINGGEIELVDERY